MKTRTKQVIASDRAANVRIANAAVRRVFESYDSNVRAKLLDLRALILECAAKTPGVGRIDETLKWNEPAYVTAESGSGSTIRIHAKADSTKYALYFNCNTSLVDTFRTLFPKEFVYLGNREIEFDVMEKPAMRPLAICITMALTYHLNKKSKS